MLAGKSISAIIGPLIAAIVVMVTVVVVVGIFLIWRRNKRSKGYKQGKDYQIFSLFSFHYDMSLLFPNFRSTLRKDAGHSVRHY